MNTTRRQSPWGQHLGFTLVELITVIVILGVLAATAIAKFVDLGFDAHRVLVAATASAFHSAVRLAFAKCFVSNWAGMDDLPGFCNGDVDFNSACYPSDTNGSNSIGSNNIRCARVWDAILQAAPSVAVNPNSDYRASASGEVCTFTYQLDTSVTREFTYDSLTGAVVVTSNP